MNQVEVLTNIEETLSAMVTQLSDKRKYDVASEALDIAVLVHRLKRKVERK